jgi:hypothetical protein
MGDELARWPKAIREAGRVPDAVLLVDAPASLTDLARFRRTPGWVARFQGFFAATSLVGRSGEWSYLAAWAPGPTSPVFTTHQDEWGDIWPAEASMAAWRAALAAGEEPKGRGSRLEPHLDPIRLLPRSRWLSRVFLGVHAESRAEARKLAPGPAVWAKEKKELARWPHLAAYWLLHHAFFGSAVELAEALRLSKRVRHGVVAEARRVAEALAAGKAPPAPWKNLAAEKRRFNEKPPPRIDAKAARKAESAAFEALKKTARDARGKKAFAILAASRAAPLVADFKRQMGFDFDEANRRLASLIDGRFSDYLKARVRLFATLSSGGGGTVLNLRRSLPDVAAFRDVLEEIDLRNLNSDQLSWVVEACKNDASAAAKAFRAKANELLEG